MSLLCEPIPFNRRPNDMLKNQYSIVGKFPILFEEAIEKYWSPLYMKVAGDKSSYLTVP